MTQLTRRDFLYSTAVVCASSIVRGAESDAVPERMTFSFGTYGMKELKSERALRTIAEIGYDGVELCVRPEWDAYPKKFDAARRRNLRRLLNDTGLQLTALMEHLPVTSEQKQKAESVERLKRAAEFGHQLSPERPPIVQTVLGGGKWEDVKELQLDWLACWVEVAVSSETVIAVKPHRGGAMSQPSQAVWLIEQLGKPKQLRICYDYSHYAFRDLSVKETVQTALPWLAHVAIKDAIQENGKVRFDLPGANGKFDYGDLFRRLKAGGYRGDVCCEVSGMVWNRPDYDPFDAAKRCYENIAPVFQANTN